MSILRKTISIRSELADQLRGWGGSGRSFSRLVSDVIECVVLDREARRVAIEAFTVEELVGELGKRTGHEIKIRIEVG